MVTSWTYAGESGTTLRQGLVIWDHYNVSLLPGTEVIKLFSYSTKLSMTFILPINVKMPTIVDILTFISMINITSERLRARDFFICLYF